MKITKKYSIVNVVGTMLFVLFVVSLLIPTKVSVAEVNFETDVWPTFKERCISCHGSSYKDSRGRTRNAKAGLRLDSPERINLGSEENSDVLIAGNAVDSSLVKLLLLPEDHDDVMPPKDGRLTEEQIKAITDWVNEGANFGSWKGLPEKYEHDTLNEKNNK